MGLWKVVILFVLLATVSSRAYYEPDDKDKFAGKKEMNGISYDAYRNFAQKWKLVTARYRKDTKEIRFVYANAAALRALLAGAKTYPEGAVFAKLAVEAKEDPKFISSDVPSGATRIQYMVRDQKRFQDTQGWGYAIFDAKGRTFPEDPALKTKACAACHNLATDTGYVFSEPVAFLYKNWKRHAVGGMPLRFVVTSRARLPSIIAAQLPEAAAEVALVDAKAIQDVFQGTLDEVAPALLKEAKSRKMPAAFVSPDSTRFTLVWADSLGHCGERLSLHRVTTRWTEPEHAATSAPLVDRRDFCDSE